MNTQLRKAIEEVCQKLFSENVVVNLSRPEEKFGDFATNIALKLASETAKSPRDIAEAIAVELKNNSLIKEVQIAGPGFINIRIKENDLFGAARSATKLDKHLAGKEILVEFGDPNPFKELHIGHAYSYIVGDAISSLLEAAGAKVHRLSYHGDVGLHVAKAIWGMQQAGAKPDSSSDKIRQNIGLYYVKGAQAYASDAAAKIDIDHINKHIYSGGNKELTKLYEWGKQTSFAYFDNVLKDLDINTAERFYERQAAEEGIKLVRQYEGKVFDKSDGAVVYKGEKAGLHTRVFITSSGLPTYETKDLGLAKLKDEKYPHSDRSLIVTAHEQAEYFKVMLAALAEIDRPLAEKTTHLYHGFVSLSSGKMSSRSGDVYGAVSLIADVDQAIGEAFGQKNDSVRNAAIKYGFLKHRLGSDIVYDVNESVSLEGNSGPYLQYAHARAASILTKVKPEGQAAELDEHERSLALKISQFPEVVLQATADFEPHQVCNYLYELSQNFNRFYEHCRVAGDPREGLRASLVQAYKDVLAHGLKILNIESPQQI